MMTSVEIQTRATQRSIAERLHTFKIAGQPIYMVRSRTTEPGSMHQVHVTAGTVDHCSCKGWFHRQSCTHAAAVTRRLEREARARKTTATDDAPMDNASTTKRQLFRSEA
jgi:hypothetical protein